MRAEERDKVINNKNDVYNCTRDATDSDPASLHSLSMPPPSGFTDTDSG